MDLSTIKTLINSYAWLGTIIAFIIGLFLGPGFIWQYKNIGISEKKLRIDQIKLENEIRKQLIDLQNDISNRCKEYVEVRDRYIRQKDKDKHVEYALQNQYNSIKSTMIKLISDFNILEMKLSQLELREPIFFDTFPIIPPTAPIDLQIKMEDGRPFLTASWEEDEVTKEVRRNLISLLERHGIKIDVEKKSHLPSQSEK